MTVISVGRAKSALTGFIKAAQADRVLITRHGKPAAILFGVSGLDLEELLTLANPRFWQFVDYALRTGTTMSPTELRRRLLATPKKRRRSELRRARIERKAGPRRHHGKPR
jgi:hypothetical protein